MIRASHSDRASGSVTAGGQNPRFNKITIDGVSASDTFGLDGNNMPTQRQPVSMEAIEAIDLNLSNYDVIYSGAAGVNVNAVTKSGTKNHFHGSVYGYYRDSEWFGEFPARVAGAATDVTGLEFDEFDHEQTYGMTFGGPIVEDRLSSSRTTKNSSGPKSGRRAEASARRRSPAMPTSMPMTLPKCSASRAKSTVSMRAA